MSQFSSQWVVVFSLFFVFCFFLDHTISAFLVMDIVGQVVIRGVTFPLVKRFSAGQLLGLYVLCGPERLTPCLQPAVGTGVSKDSASCPLGRFLFRHVITYKGNLPNGIYICLLYTSPSPRDS